MDPVNSFISLANQIVALNKNCVEILTKTDSLVSSTDSSVKVNYDNNGVISSYSLPTVGSLKNQIDTLNQNMMRMASIDGYTFIRDGQSFKRILVSDLNREPMPIGSISQVSTFSPINNHFFESLMNPMLAVTIDLTDKVGVEVNKVLSRRYIIKFKKNVDGSLTEEGLNSYNSFYYTFLNKTDINIKDLQDWMNNPSNTGLVSDTVEPYDEQIYDLKLKNLKYYGIFSVIKLEVDDINNKMWYHLNDIKYYGVDNTIKTLSIGDELIINRLNSSSRYKIIEVNTDSSNNKIRVQNVEGFDPIVIGTNVLKYYSDVSSEKKVQINVGFEEYLVVFIKPINTDDNIVGNLWSKGISFFTNNLVLDTNNNLSLSNYYVQSVYDYGTYLRDAIKKTIPTVHGIKPNVVNLNSNNFAVVQINKHLTEDKDQNTLKKLHSDKTTVKTKISQLNSAISQKTAQLSASDQSSTVKQSLSSEINKLKSDLDINTKNLSSILSQLNDINSNVNNNVSPKYRLRGFWKIPEPVVSDKTDPQHVVQFRVEYRYSSKNGNSNNVQTFNYQDTTNSTPVVTTTTIIEKPITTTIVVKEEPVVLSTGDSGTILTPVTANATTSTNAEVANTVTQLIVEPVTTTTTQVATTTTTTTVTQTPPKEIVEEEISPLIRRTNIPTKLDANNIVKGSQLGDTNSIAAYISATDVTTTTENPSGGPKYASFSNWVPYLTDVRKRYWDETTKSWYWKIEDVSDADTPNINQLDIPISPDERIEFRIKSISEVGWPDSLLESDWSDSISMDFPDELKDVLSDNNYILKEASLDESVSNVNDSLTSRGVYKHIDESFYVNQDYFAHMDKSIQVGFKNSTGAQSNLFDYLTQLTNRITYLEEYIAGSKGTAKISIFKKTDLVKTILSNTTTSISIECEDYGIASGSTRSYQNGVYLIDDYSITIENIAQSGSLGFLSNRNYNTTYSPPFYSDNMNNILMINVNNELYTQTNNQFVWFADKDNNDWISTGTTNMTGGLTMTNYNFGATGSTSGVYMNLGDIDWVSGSPADDFECAVFPYLSNLNDLVENGQEKIKYMKPQDKFTIGLKIFFKFDSNATTTPYLANSSIHQIKTRKVKTWFETSSNIINQFTVTFSLSNYRLYLKQTSSNI